jgi:WD40 repeat protein
VSQAAILDAFARALRRETHNLAQRPDLLWQQLHNRLQWVEGAVLTLVGPELERRTAPGMTPWLRTRTPFREVDVLLQILEGHTSHINGCAFSPDGRRLASASQVITPATPATGEATARGELRLWDAESGAELRVLEGHTSSISDCAFSPDGCYLASASWDETLRLWDAESGVELGVLEGHTREVDACAFSPDGRQLVSASSDETLRLWDAESGALLGVLEGHAGPVLECTFSPDGDRICSASDDHTLRFWEAESGDQLAVLQGHTHSVVACAFSPDGRRLASAGWDGTLRLWDVESGAELEILAGHTDKVLDCVFSPDGRRIASAGWDKTLRIWDAESGEGLAILPLLGAGRSVAHHPQLPLVVGGDADGGVYLAELSISGGS